MATVWFVRDDVVLIRLSPFRYIETASAALVGVVAVLLSDVVVVTVGSIVVLLLLLLILLLLLRFCFDVAFVEVVVIDCDATET